MTRTLDKEKATWTLDKEARGMDTRQGGEGSMDIRRGGEGGIDTRSRGGGDMDAPRTRGGGKGV